jgi:rhomboid-related protein 1/2/3
MIIHISIRIFAAGLLIGIPVLKNIHVKPWERVVWWVALIVYLLCLVFAILWNAFYPHFPETDWRPCCPMPKY